MRGLLWFVAGALFVIAVAVAAGTVFAITGRGFSARAQPSSAERWLARTAHELAIPVDAKAQTNPTPDTPEALAEARAHWADHCATCHANNGSGDTEIGKGLYPPAPDMRKAETQNMTDGELFYIIQNGVRLTGMPAWGGGSGHDAEDSWKLVRFIRHLPQMSTTEELEMQQLNPKTPDEIKEEQEENDFLNGGDTNEPKEQHHH